MCMNVCVYMCLCVCVSFYMYIYINKLSLKSNILIVHTHKKQTINNVLKDFLKKGDSNVTETKRLQLNVQK